jgi:hypothetical protein
MITDTELDKLKTVLEEKHKKDKSEFFIVLKDPKGQTRTIAVAKKSTLIAISNNLEKHIK